MNAPLTQPEQFVVATGSPATGFVLTGPFPTRQEATQWAQKGLDFATHYGARWWVMPLFKPKE